MILFNIMFNIFVTLKQVKYFYFKNKIWNYTGYTIIVLV